MCWMAIGAIAGLGGQAGGMFGGIGSNYAKADSARFNAGIARQNAEIKEQDALNVEKVGAREVEKQNETTQQLIGTQQAMFGASGATVGVGSTADVVNDSYRYGVQDALQIKYNTAYKAWGERSEGVNYENQALMYEGEAQQAEASARSTVNLLSGGNPLLGYVFSGGREKPTALGMISNSTMGATTGGIWDLGTGYAKQGSKKVQNSFSAVENFINK